MCNDDRAIIISDRRRVKSVHGKVLIFPVQVYAS
jgi:hypothetical protein